MGGTTRFVVAGESLVDLIGEPGGWTFTARPGGSPFSVAVGLATRGHPVRLASEVGDDFFGGLLRAELVARGVDAADLAVTAAPTSLAFVQLDSAGVADYDFRFSWRFAAGVSLVDVDCLHVGSLGTAVPPGADAVAELARAARDAGITVSYDPNVRPSLAGPRDAAATRVERLVGLADVVKASAEDLAWLYPGETDLAVAARWSGLGPALVVVTRGGEGALGLHAGRLTRCTAPPVRVVDTVGAGDAFTAELLSTLAGAGGFAGRPLPGVDRALQQATAAASAVCTQRGAAPAPADLVARLAAQTRLETGLPVPGRRTETVC